MRAAVLAEYGAELVVEDVTLPPLGPADVHVRIDASGVCHSDLSTARGGVPKPPPLILGHEGTGTVVGVGPDVTRVRTGDRVVASFIPSCGACWYCVHGESNHCEKLRELAGRVKARRHDGTVLRGTLATFADEMVADESLVVKVETDVPPEQLALIGCGVMTGVGAALNTAQVASGSTVAVIGCGGVGQSVIQGARIAGAARIFAVDPVELKRKTAEQLGATDLVDPADDDTVQMLRAATGGRGPDYVFEVLGRPDTIVQAYEATRPGGTTVVVGMTHLTETVTLPAFSFISDAKRLLGCTYGSAQVRRDFPMLVKLIEAGRLDVGALVSRRIGLHEVNDAFRATEARRGDPQRHRLIDPTKGVVMPRYMAIARYTPDGLQGLVKGGGGTARRAAAVKAVEALGGKLESFDFAFGEDDVYVIADLPDNVTMAAVGLAVGASGAIATRTIVLLTPEEIDAAVEKHAAFSPPGS
jgi:S-(hydroxymethyl)glutathione dehydrogenase/alcohol dehydrogenase